LLLIRSELQIDLHSNLVRLNVTQVRQWIFRVNGNDDIVAELKPIETTTGLFTFTRFVHFFDPQMVATSAAGLSQKCAEIGSLLLTTAPEFHSFVKDWRPGVMFTRIKVALLRFVRLLASRILASCSHLQCFRCRSYQKEKKNGRVSDLD
jgi:hypothetical protein